MKLNKKSEWTAKTHEGAPAAHLNAEQQLRRSVMSCMLWESEFYEDGEEIAERIWRLCKQVSLEKVADIAIEAREKMKLRHVPLLLVRWMATAVDRSDPAKIVSKTLARIIQRPDELSEFVAIYWKDRKQPLSAQVKKGLAEAFLKFDEYRFAKYNRDSAIKLRDVMFLCHPRPRTDSQAVLFKKIADQELATPDTWEVALSAGADKKVTWERLIVERKLGALAVLRNLRNMRQANVSQPIIEGALASMNTERVLPFRFIAAARHAPELEPQIEEAMLKCLGQVEALPGHTVVLIDVSSSMDSEISGKSDMKRIDAACGLAVLIREICEKGSILTFSDNLAVVPARHGFALRDAVVGSQSHGGTELGKAIDTLKRSAREAFDRIIVITDEQSSDAVGPPPAKRGYMINVASNIHGVGQGPWHRINGWSEAVIDYIREYEKGE